jgi:hypothetical protein
MVQGSGIDGSVVGGAAVVLELAGEWEALKRRGDGMRFAKWSSLEPIFEAYRS